MKNFGITIKEKKLLTNIFQKNIGKYHKLTFREINSTPVIWGAITIEENKQFSGVYRIYANINPIILTGNNSIKFEKYILSRKQSLIYFVYNLIHAIKYIIKRNLTYKELTRTMMTVISDYATEKTKNLLYIHTEKIGESL